MHESAYTHGLPCNSQYLISLLCQQNSLSGPFRLLPQTRFISLSNKSTFSFITFVLIFFQLRKLLSAPCEGKLANFCRITFTVCRSQWPRRLRRRSAAARMLRLWVRIPPGAWMFVCCECCVLSGRGLCDGLITRPEESYRLWRVVVCHQDTSNMRRFKPATGLWKIVGCNARKTNKQTFMVYLLVILTM